MSLNFRDDILKACKKHFEAQIEKHRINVEVMLENVVGIGEHSDIIETVEKEIDMIASYDDKLSVLNKYLMNGWATVKKKEVLNG